MNEKIKALKAAFPHTIPVLTGFLFLGIAFGILMNTKGYGVVYSVLMSAFIFAGSMQFVTLTLLTSAFHPLYALLLTLVVNARHLFYGISMLTKFKGTGRFKPYLIFALCDETFSILCSTEPPENVDRNWFMFFIALLDHCYWVLGCAIGGLLGYMVHINTKGLDFVLTALFAVIFINQWKSQKSHIPAIVGVLGSLICLFIFGPDHFIIPAMVTMLATLTLLKKNIEKGEN